MITSITVMPFYRPNRQKGQIFYLIASNELSINIKSDLLINSNEWNELSAFLLTQPKQKKKIQNKYLDIISDFVAWDIKRLKLILYSLHDIKDKRKLLNETAHKFSLPRQGMSLFRFAQEIIYQLRSWGKIRTSETYTSTLNSFMRFRAGIDLPLQKLDSDLIKSYEVWLEHQNVCMNTSSFYMRILRAIYNRAVEKELIYQRNPFRHVYVGVDKTIKRALPLSVIKQIREIDLSENPNLCFARDLFLFSFYTRGMSFIDIAFLRKKDLHNGSLSYRRRKTGQMLFIKWEYCMEEIVTRYAQQCERSPYLLPIIMEEEKDTYQCYRKNMSRINKQLKLLATRIGYNYSLSMYCARHSWANIAKSKNIPIAVISEGMGHDSEKTTRIYLASLDTHVVDQANQLVLSCL